MDMFQSNIYYYVRIKSILCMYKILVHAKNLGPKNKPLLLGRCAASGGFFSRKKGV